MENNEKRIKLTFNKKVISISFLALALFMLLAVSYAYFTATVTGNESAKKTIVTTGKMSLVFNGENIIETKDNMVPGESVELKFSVLNNGNVATTYNIDMIDVENNFNPTSDLVYTVTSNNNGGSKSETVAPSQSETLIRNILIQPGENNKQEYVLKLEFKETHSNQNSNQNKTFKGKVQINKLTDDSIATTILRANPIQNSEDIDFSKGSPYCNDTNCTSTTENGTGLFAAHDDDGTSYYFRGAVTNNNVHFADKDWKIVRINGDGTIRIIEAEAPYRIDCDYISNPGCESDPNSIYFNNKAFYALNNFQYYMSGYTYNNKQNCTKDHPCISDYDGTSFTNDYGGTDGYLKESLEQLYKSNLKKYDDKIALATYCSDTSIVNKYNDEHQYTNYDYSPKQRILTDHKPILTCPDPTEYQSKETHNYGGVYKLKIGLLTADEMIMSGHASGYNNINKAGPKNYLYHDFVVDYPWWSMTPITDDEMSIRLDVFINYNGYISGSTAWDPWVLLPVINLNADVEFTGTGTADDPYTVSS